MKKTCKRKHYPLINCISMAMEGAAIVQDSAMVSLRAVELEAVKAFAEGAATQDDWNTVAAMLNLCHDMANQKVGHEAIPVCQEVHAHLKEARQRCKDTGRLGLTGSGIVAIRNLYDYHELQRTAISRLEYEQHITRTTRRVRNKAKGVICL